MNQVKKIRETNLIRGLSSRLAMLKLPGRITLMEVCGTHTMAIHRAGLPALFPENLRLLSGPGCPVCVTPASYIDTAVEMAQKYTITLATFGDMMRVPGNAGTLAELRSEGYPVEIVYSPLNAVELAREKPGFHVVFLAVGFETTAPTVAASVLYARENHVMNFSILAAHKLIIPALELLVSDARTVIDGFILPGHVSIVLGSEPYRFLPEKYNRACVITGFETADIIQGILMLSEQIAHKEFDVQIQYRRAVRPYGNARARECMNEVFVPVDTEWRGFGRIPLSGLAVRNEFSEFDAEKLFSVKINEIPEPEGCLCGEVLQGHVEPGDCSLFAKVCTPDNPVGPCMVSSEGTCAAFYRYSRRQGARYHG